MCGMAHNIRKKRERSSRDAAQPEMLGAKGGPPVLRSWFKKHQPPNEHRTRESAAEDGTEWQAIGCESGLASVTG